MFHLKIYYQAIQRSSIKSPHYPFKYMFRNILYISFMRDKDSTTLQLMYYHTKIFPTIKFFFYPNFLI